MACPIPRTRGQQSEWKIAERLQRYCRVKSMLLPPAPSDTGGMGFAGGPLSPNLVPHTTCSLFPYGPTFARRRGLVIAPGLLHMGGGKIWPANAHLDSKVAFI